ncbi:unnamed protein product [Spirodela intermedia]|uniref:RNase H type-1 domain-containing protein n=1 Tax=Spirodela intermedia TaxID=51605 RepID=A0A7I8JH61_SPIIN|nr:unnamed protein product [Spirodela intermedia]CAA6669476.1 unnamed protein product [Spirodela intermedia]
MKPLIRWRVGQGTINAWYNTWLANTPLASYISFTPIHKSLCELSIRDHRLIGHLKLNVDGAAHENPGLAGGGGNLRDHTRSIIFAFSHYYNVQTNTVAEAMAIHDGLLLYEECNLHGIVLESDSRVLVEMLRVGTCSHWRLRSTWMDIMCCREKINAITHQLCEGIRLQTHLLHMQYALI